MKRQDFITSGTKINNNYGLTALNHQGIHLWNTLPPETRALSSLRVFREEVAADLWARFDDMHDTDL